MGHVLILEVGANNMSEDTAATNGAAGEFSIGAILDLVAPFEFPFEGQKLTGKWYKYKTSTREYIKTKVAERNEQLDRFQALRRDISMLEPGDEKISEMTAECERLEEAVQRTNYAWLTDAVIEWNMVLSGKPVPITAAGFNDVPIPVLTALDQFLIDSRTDKNPTLSDS